MVSEFLQFYADTPSVKNKFFSFRINSVFDLETSLKRFMKSFYIRSAWYVAREGKNVVENSKIDLVQFLDFNTLRFNPSSPPYRQPPIS